jgi:2-polyprenyl-6-methoxyphenol hydroxylase-like FAD-dependent oxidoreductase
VDILISGLGIAGPTLAWWLERRGFRPVIVEHAPKPRTSGYIIDFWGRGFDIAEAMGAMPALREVGYRIEEVRIVDRKGRRAGGFDAKGFARLAGNK